MKRIFYGITYKQAVIIAVLLVSSIIVADTMTIRQLTHVDKVVITGIDGLFVLAENRMITIGFVPMILGAFYEVLFSSLETDNILVRSIGRKNIVRREIVTMIIGSLAAFVLSIIVSFGITIVICHGNMGLEKLTGNIAAAIVKVIIINSFETLIVITLFDILRNLMKRKLPSIILLYGFCTVFGVYPRTSSMAVIFGIKVSASSYYKEACGIYGVKVIIAALLIEMMLSGIVMLVVSKKDYLR